MSRGDELSCCRFLEMALMSGCVCRDSVGVGVSIVINKYTCKISLYSQKLVSKTMGVVVLGGQASWRKKREKGFGSTQAQA